MIIPAQCIHQALNQLVKLATRNIRAASAWIAAHVGTLLLKIFLMKRIKILIETFLIIAFIYYFILKPIFWIIDKLKEGAR